MFVKMERVRLERQSCIEGDAQTNIISAADERLAVVTNDAGRPQVVLPEEDVDLLDDRRVFWLMVDHLPVVQ